MSLSAEREEAILLPGIFGWKEDRNGSINETSDYGEDEGEDSGFSVSLSGDEEGDEGDQDSSIDVSAEDEQESAVSQQSVSGAENEGSTNDMRHHRSHQRRSSSPAPSYVSMKSNFSMVHPRNFTNGGVPVSHWSAAVTCDLCTQKMERAVKFCLTCCVSFCEPHVRQHYTVPALQRHILVKPSGDLEETLRAQLSAAVDTPGQRPNKAAKSGVRDGLPELRIALLGSTGAGKSTTGNTILGRGVFEEDFSPKPVTVKVQRHSGLVDGRSITVTDTPGPSDTLISTEAVKRELVLRNIHVFLLVIRLGRFTEGDRNAVRWIQENLGEEALRYTMVLFTGGDQLKRNIEEFMKLSSDLQGVIKSCAGGYHVFNNQEKGNFTQVLELLNKIEALIYRNGGYYISEKFQEIRRRTAQVGSSERELKLEKALNTMKRKKREKEIREEEQKKREESEARIRKEEERKREKAERCIRREEDIKRQEAEKRIREEEERKREEVESCIRREEEIKRQEAERRIRADEQRKRELMKRVEQNSLNEEMFTSAREILFIATRHGLIAALLHLIIQKIQDKRG